MLCFLLERPLFIWHVFCQCGVPLFCKLYLRYVYTLVLNPNYLNAEPAAEEPAKEEAAAPEQTTEEAPAEPGRGSL